MSETTLRITRVDACPCGTHALVLLVDDEDLPRARLRISIEAGRALAAFEAGLPGGMDAVLAALEQCLRALGAVVTAVLLSKGEEHVRTEVQLRSAEGKVTDVLVEPGVGLLAARALRVPIGLAPPRAAAEPAASASPTVATPIPEAFRPLIEHLRWDDL
ncbi:MAG: hypothetical protein AB7I38_01055 [Dehalococcoidia bacterium]